MDFRELDIQIPHGKISGEIRTTCPKCSHERKKSKAKDLAVNLDKEMWHCHHCQWSGKLFHNEPKKEWVKPTFTNLTELPKKVVDYFFTRGISSKTLLKMKIGSGMEFMPQENKEVSTIQFNYFKNGELVNVKYRDGKKNFKLHKGAELCLYNFDCLKDCTESLFICEGEIDCLSLIEAGFENVVSVPNGATTGAANLDYLDSAIEYLEKIPKIILVTDNDKPGRNLANALRERLGVEKCYYIELGEFKDPNEVLQKKGVEALQAILNDVKAYPLEGSFTISDIYKEIEDMHENGLDSGFGINLPEFDKCLKFAMGYVTTITGIPSHGKTTFLDFICMRLNLIHGLKGAYYSPENKPTQLHFSKLARTISGKYWNGNYGMNIDEVRQVADFLNDKIFFIKPPKGFTLDNILQSVKELILRHGIKWFVIDAWNKIADTDSNLDVIRKQLNQISEFCETNNVHCFLVAHPTKMQINPKTKLYDVPKLYNISGSSHFYNITDNGIIVYRDYQTNMVEVIVEKVKFQHWGEGGRVEFGFHKSSMRYYCGIPDVGNWINDGFNAKFDNGNQSRQDNLKEVAEAMRQATISKADFPAENPFNQDLEFDNKDGLPF